MTAVEWLLDALNKEGISLYTPEIIEQAKEMEAKQRQEDINRGYLEGYDDGTKGKEPIMPRPLYVCESSYTEIPLDKNGKPIII